MKKRFLVVHTHGVEFTEGKHALDALGKAYLPLGFRDAQAVFAEEVVFMGPAAPGAFTALIAEPLGNEAPR